MRKNNRQRQKNRNNTKSSKTPRVRSFVARNASTASGSTNPKNNKHKSSKPRTRSTHKVSYKKYISAAQKHKQYIPDNSFEDLVDNPTLLENIDKLGYINPTPAQDEAIEQISKQIDTYLIAQTGTGKTAAYLIPLIEKALKKDVYKTLIMVPTRELTYQVNSELNRLIENLELSAVTITGKQSMSVQIALTQKPHNFLIATPGRLLDIHHREKIDLKKYNTVVVDEADRMFDMGFQADLIAILKDTAQYKQIIYTSATSNPRVEELSQEFSPKVEQIKVSKSTPTALVHQEVVTFKTEKDKIETLHDILILGNLEKALVFVNRRQQADELFEELKKRGFKVGIIHGEITQHRRKNAVEKLKKGEIKVLVATDVAARGIHVDGITHVVNYEEPLTYHDYVHRIGRTGRAGEKGWSCTFLPEKRIGKSRGTANTNQKIADRKKRKRK